MATALRVLVPAYCVAFVLACLLWPALRFRRATGRSPFIPGGLDTPHGFVAALSSLLMPALGFVAILYALSPPTYAAWMRPFSWYGAPAARWAGVVALLAALVLTVTAQRQMGLSWRVGFGTAERTEVVRHGLYRRSRNPIYLGLLLIAAGFFLILPDPLTLLVLVEGWTVLQILVRLEEQHLRTLHGEAFAAYCREVPRWLLR